MKKDWQWKIPLWIIAFTLLGVMCIWGKSALDIAESEGCPVGGDNPRLGRLGKPRYNDNWFNTYTNTQQSKISRLEVIYSFKNSYYDKAKIEITYLYDLKPGEKRKFKLAHPDFWNDDTDDIIELLCVRAFESREIQGDKR